MDISELRGKKITVVGLAKTGVALTQFLVKHGAQVTVSDHKSKPELIQYLEQIKDLEWTSDLGGHTSKLLLQQDVVILSPGISPHLKIFDYIKNQGVSVTGEMEFVSQFVKKPIVAVTGTNGKTEVSYLIELMLKESGVKVWAGGNFKKPLSSYFLEEDKDEIQYLVLEVSSFMLEHAEKFCPRVIVFTNLSEDHLDRHKYMESYINAKRKIFKNTNEETTSILNADDSAVVELARDRVVQGGRIFYFSRKSFLEPQIMNIGGAVESENVIKVRTGPESEYYFLENLKTKGEYAHENLMAALLAARECGATKSAIEGAIRKYKGLPHRLEYVRKVRGADFYNDSKSTNPHSVKKALESFDENIILIMGGKETNLSYSYLKSIIKRKVKLLILLGEAKERINREVGGVTETFLIGTFDEAILIAYQKSRVGDTILLSPGCSSFDAFDNYVERGNCFKKIVNGFD